MTHVKTTPPDIFLVTCQTTLSPPNFTGLTLKYLFIHSLNSLKIFASVVLEMINDFQINTIALNLTISKEYLTNLLTNI